MAWSGSTHEDCWVSTTKCPAVGDLVRILPEAVEDGWFGGLAVVTDIDTSWDSLAQEEFQELELLWSVTGAVGWILTEYVELIEDQSDLARVMSAGMS